MKKYIFLLIIFTIGCGSEKTIKFQPWPEGNVYYKFSEEIEEHNRKKIEFVFDQIEDRTKCIYFIKTDSKKAVNITYSKKNTNSSASSGFNSKNIFAISNSKWISKRTIYHETFHILGFNHEHQRPDREDYVEIIYDNILNESKSAFDITEHLYDTEVFEYEYNSIMHYSEKSFSENGLNTIIFLTLSEFEYVLYPTDLDWSKLISIYQPSPKS